MTCYSVRLFVPAVVALVFGLPARGADDPLRFVPDSAALVLKIEKPRELVESGVTLDAVRGIRAFPQVRELLDSTPARRFFQVVSYYEKELGHPWPELLDRLAGGGIVVGSTLGPDPAPALLVIQGTDEQLTARAFDLILGVIEQELARQEAKERPAKGEYRGVATASVGKDLHAARVGATVFVSNKREALHAGLDLAAARKPAAADRPAVAAARKLLPADPLAWLWLDFAKIKQDKATKDFFDNIGKDFLGNLVAGGTIDCLRRADFVAVGLTRDAGGYRLAVRLPAGRGEMRPELGVHVPPAGAPGILPLLEPAGVLYSQSFYLDLAAWWRDREKLINADQLKDIEKAEKDISKVVPGPGLGKLFALSGPHHRLVAANQDAQPYTTTPAQRLPAFGVVTAMRDPAFGKSLDGLLRGGALIAGLQVGLKMKEETIDGVKVVAYRFPEDKPFPVDDPGNLRFNFEPCFAVVDDQFVACSTVELMRKLIPDIRRTAKQPGSAAVWRSRAYAAGGAAGLEAAAEPAVTNAVLTQGVSLDEAKRQVKDLAAWIKTLGTVRLEMDQAEKAYKFDIVWQFGK